MELKEKLLTLGVFIDNEYLDNYCNLIESNRDTPVKKYCTQNHHIIPRCYYRLNNIKVDNSEENRVNLLFKDHVKAHCYIVLCSVDSLFKYYNMLSVYKTINHKYFKCIDCSDLNEIQLAYEEARKIAYKYNPMNVEKHRKAHDDLMGSEEIRQKISAGMKKYREEFGFSDEHRKNLSKTAKEQVWIVHPETMHRTHINKHKLEEYFNKGYILSKDYFKWDNLDNITNAAVDKHTQCHCILSTGEIYNFENYRLAGRWWFENYKPFGEHYVECTFQRKIKASIAGNNPIIYTTSKGKKQKIIVDNIKWYAGHYIEGGDENCEKSEN